MLRVNVGPDGRDAALPSGVAWDPDAHLVSLETDRDVSLVLSGDGEPHAPLARLAADLQERKTAGDLATGSLTGEKLSPSARLGHYPKGQLPADPDYVHARNRLAAQALGFSADSARVVDVERAWNDRTDINQRWGDVDRMDKTQPDQAAKRQDVVDATGAADRDQQERVRALGREGSAERAERRRDQWWREDPVAPSL